MPMFALLERYKWFINCHFFGPADNFLQGFTWKDTNHFLSDRTSDTCYAPLSVTTFHGSCAFLTSHQNAPPICPSGGARAKAVGGGDDGDGHEGLRKGDIPAAKPCGQPQRRVLLGGAAERPGGGA